MDVPAKVTSKGRVTIPAAVRRPLPLQPGTRVVFHLDPGGVSMDVPGGTTRATLRTYPDFFDLAGTVPVPHELSGATWDEVRAEARASRARRRSAAR